MLTVKQRQQYLKSLGFYKGEINGVEDKATKEAYLQLQKRYFRNKRDIDGLYGKNTDVLLVNAHRVKVNTKNFKLDDFICSCKGRLCTGYPVYLDVQLLKNIQATRDHFKKPMTITCGARCLARNKELENSIATSLHLKGKAADFQMDGVTNVGEEGKLKVRKFWMTLPNANYSYGYLPKKGTTALERRCTNMMYSSHCDVK